MDQLILLVIWIAFALICYGLAKDKGKNIYIAFALGLLLGIFAVFYYFFSKGSKEYQLKKTKEMLKKLGK